MPIKKHYCSWCRKKEILCDVCMQCECRCWCVDGYDPDLYIEYYEELDREKMRLENPDHLAGANQ